MSGVFPCGGGAHSDPLSLGRSATHPGMREVLTEMMEEDRLCVELYFECIFLVVCLTFRHNKNKRRAQEVSEKLRDNRDLRHFLQNTQDVSSPSVYCSCNHRVPSISSLIIS